MFNTFIVIVKTNLFVCKIVLPIKTNVLFVLIIVYIFGYERDLRSCEHLPLRRSINLFATDAEWTHCMLHREAMVSKKMSNKLNKVFNEAIKIIYFIKS